MKHPPLVIDIKYYRARVKILDTYIKANQDLHKKLLDLLGKVNNLVQHHNIGIDLKTEVEEEINRVETSITVSRDEKEFLERRIHTLLAA